MGLMFGIKIQNYENPAVHHPFSDAI